MGIFDLFRWPDTRQEYSEGRIPGSTALPLQSLSQIGALVPDKDTALYVYCLSGARSAQAVRLLRSMGYSQASDIGGISGYSGELEQ